MKGLIDNASGHEHQITLLWQAIQKLARDADHEEARTCLPRDAQSILELAARSMFDLFANASEGMLLVDRAGRVVWINDKYAAMLGLDNQGQALGRDVEELIPNSMLREVMRLAPAQFARHHDLRPASLRGHAHAAARRRRPARSDQ